MGDKNFQVIFLVIDWMILLPVVPCVAAALDEAVKRTRPSLVLELGTHCGYSSVRMLRLLPPAGKLITVELDPLTADLGEEIILVAGFKHKQVNLWPVLRSRMQPNWFLQKLKSPFSCGLLILCSFRY